jgi:hypothetical protein
MSPSTLLCLNPSGLIFQSSSKELVLRLQLSDVLSQAKDLSFQIGNFL